MYYKDLDVWKSSIELVELVYKITREFPNIEIYGLASQMRRAAISIPSNISEGVSRFSDKDKLRFLEITKGSLAELETQVIISERLGYIKDTTAIINQINKINALLAGLKKYLEKNTY